MGTKIPNAWQFEGSDDLSRPKYWWYSNVVRAIRCYPDLERAKADEQMPSIVAGYSGMPRGGGVGRMTEQCAMRGLSRPEEEVIDAVRQAIVEFETRPEGADVLGVVSLYHWKRRGDFGFIGYKLHIGKRTVERYNRQFVYAVARNLGYLQKNGVSEPNSRDTMSV